MQIAAVEQGEVMRGIIVLSTSVVLMLSAVGVGGAKGAGARQMSTPPQQGQSQGSRPSIDQDNGAPDAFKDRMEAQAARGRVSERHRKIAADTDKLLQLSTELKADVDKTTKDEMSIAVIQKAAEIEKLARDVKERMKGQ